MSDTAVNSDTSVNSTPPHFAFDKVIGAKSIVVASFKGIATPIAYRPDDEPIVESIFNGNEYELLVANFNPKLILDCGGNIGCAAVYFANKYPEAQIYSIEPQINNFKILQYNTFFYDKIHPINSALWDKETFIRVEDKGYGVAGYMTTEAAEGEPDTFKTVTVSKLLADSGFDEIDLLKIDIEGAEKEVFSAPDVDDWLAKVKILVIELHDRMKFGCSYEFFKAMSKYHWFFHLNGENLIFFRESLIA